MQIALENSWIRILIFFQLFSFHRKVYDLMLDKHLLYAFFNHHRTGCWNTYWNSILLGWANHHFIIIRKKCSVNVTTLALLCSCVFHNSLDKSFINTPFDTVIGNRSNVCSTSNAICIIVAWKNSKNLRCLGIFIFISIYKNAVFSLKYCN